MSITFPGHSRTEPVLPAAAPAEQLAAEGTAIIRGFLDDQEMTKLTAVVGEVYDLLGIHADFLEGELGENFSIAGGAQLKPLAALLAAYYPRLHAQYAEVENTVCAKTRRLFGRRWRLHTHRSYMRRIAGTTVQVPWHIDADAANTWRPNCFNVWLPLDPVGRDRPSLDVVCGSQRTMRRLPLLVDAARYRDDEFVAAIGSSSTPELNPGDALVFDQFTLHRTQCVASPATVRISCEFRFHDGLTASFVARKVATAVARRARKLVRTPH
jgi:hypothetical protein